MKRLMLYFSKAEIILWFVSVVGIVTSFCIFDRENYMTLCASIIGVTSLIFAAKDENKAKYYNILVAVSNMEVDIIFSDAS